MSERRESSKNRKDNTISSSNLSKKKEPSGLRSLMITIWTYREKIKMMRLAKIHRDLCFGNQNRLKRRKNHCHIAM
jgi:hypothetical protein